MPRFLPALLFLPWLVPTAAVAQATGDSESVVEGYLQAWSARHVDRIASFFAEDAVFQDMPNVGNGWGRPLRGREAIRAWVAEQFAAMPDLAFEWSPYGNGNTGEDLATIEWRMTGTHTGDWPGLPATGRKVSVAAVSVIEIEDGKIRRQRDYYDGYLLASQLGALPPSDDQANAVTPSAGGAGMTTPEQNKEIVRRAIAEAVNAHDLEAFRDILAPDYRRHSQATTDMQEISGVEQMMTFLQVNFTAFPDWHEEIELMIAEGDKVALITTGTGTHTGPLGDIPPTGKPIRVTNFIVQRIEDGKIAETWIGWDNLTVLSQLGLVPATGDGR